MSSETQNCIHPNGRLSLDPFADYNLLFENEYYGGLQVRFELKERERFLGM